MFKNFDYCITIKYAINPIDTFMLQYSRQSEFKMIIHNCQIITWKKPNVILNNHAVRIIEDRIAEIDEETILLEKYPREEILDAKGQVLMPGLICAHTHFYGAFSRGLAIPGKPPSNFLQILEKLWWPLDQSLQEEDIQSSALVCIIDAIKNGTTTVFDHHASPNCIDGSLDIIESAVGATGIRASLCYEVTDRGGKEKTTAGIAENVRMIKKLENQPNGSKVVATFGLHASLTLSDETLEMCVKEIPKQYGVHIHIAEDFIDQKDCLDKHGMRVVERLDKFGMTGIDSIFVHGVHINRREMEIIKNSNTWLTHQPRSNMNNAVGLPDVEEFLRAGIPVCMGNDGFSFAMWDEWRTCYLAHKSWSKDPRKMSAGLVTEMAAFNNARIASHFFKDNIGTIEAGAKADLILVDYQPFTEMTNGNLPWHIIFGFRDSMVTMTMVDGQVLMRDGQMIKFDEKPIIARATEVSKEVWKRYAAQFTY